MHFAILSGLFGCMGSSFGKISGLPVIEDLLIVRAIFVCLMMAINTLSLTYYVKAMHYSGTLSATVVSTAANYIISALSGMLIFGEATSMMWWAGMCFIITGLVLVIQDEKDTTEPKKVE